MKIRLMTLFVFIFFIASCSTFPTSFPESNEYTIDELNGVVLISNIQYELDSFPVSRNQYYYMKNSKMRIAKLTFQILKTDSTKDIDFLNVKLLDENGKEYKPEILRYFEGSSAFGFIDWGFAQLSFVGLKQRFSKNTKYTVMLGYPYEPPVKFTRAEFFGIQVAFSAELVEKEFMIDSFSIKK